MRHHLRIAALQCNFQDREHTLAMPAKWQSMGFAGEQLLHTHADMYSAIYDPAVHRELLKEYLQNSREHQLETIVYMNCHILGPSIAGKYEEWGIRNTDGKTFPRFYETYYGCCLNSGWKDYFFNCIRSLKEFSIAGLFFDGPLYTPCGCPVCRKAFEDKFGKSYDSATDPERKNFAFDRVIAFKDELYKLVKSVNPDWLMYFNEGIFAGRSGRKNMLRQLASDDIIGTEGGFFFYGPPKEHTWWHCSSRAKAAEALAEGRRTVIFQAGDHKPWGWFMHTPTETKLCYASALFNGAGIWYGIHCNPDNLETAAGRTAAGMLQFDKKHEELWEKTHSLAETAVLYSFDTSAVYPKEGETSDLYGDEARKGTFPGNYTKSFQGALAVLEHSSRSYDIVTDLNLKNLDRYKQVIVPSLAMADEDVLSALKEYVAQGGILIADGEFGRYDGKGALREQGNTGFALRFDGTIRDHKRFNYLVPDPEICPVDNAFGYMPAPQWSIGVAPDESLVCHGKCNQPLVGCYQARPGKGEIPFLFSSKIGKGKFWYCAGGFFESYFDFFHLPYRTLMKHLMKEDSFAFAEPVTGVTLSVRQNEKGTWLGICNYVSPIRPIVEPAPVRGLKIRVPAGFTAAEELLSGVKLQKNEQGCFVLPELKDIACILLK